MAILHPFPAVRPTASSAAEVASVPYDVISVAEARDLAEGNSASFLHVIRPEIDLPLGTDEHDDAVYATGARNLRAFVAADYTVVDPPSLYVYRLTMDGRSQTGVFGCVAVADYDNDVILKHEKTRPDKEDDRTRHILEQRAHAEPVMLTYKDVPAIAAIMEDSMATAPLVSFVAPDNVEHTVWSVPDVEALVSAFADVPSLYVADGHHRCKAASRAADDLGATAADEASYFPAVLFPMGDLRILSYNRVIKNSDKSASEILAAVRERLSIIDHAPARPASAGQVSLYADGKWHGILLPPSTRDGAADRLDVARLGEHFLEPILGITDPRRDPRIGFVGGIRGTTALEDAVDNGDAVVAISMYPTSIEELVAVSDAGLLMPPKSTWFEPKLRSGLLVHPF